MIWLSVSKVTNHLPETGMLEVSVKNRFIAKKNHHLLGCPKSNASISIFVKN